MLINSKEHRLQLAKQLVMIRNYRKRKGKESYIAWLKEEKRRRTFIKSMMSNFIKSMDNEILSAMQSNSGDVT